MRGRSIRRVGTGPFVDVRGCSWLEGLHGPIGQAARCGSDDEHALIPEIHSAVEPIVGDVLLRLPARPPSPGLAAAGHAPRLPPELAGDADGGCRWQPHLRRAWTTSWTTTPGESPRGLMSGGNIGACGGLIRWGLGSGGRGSSPLSLWRRLGRGGKTYPASPTVQSGLSAEKGKSVNQSSESRSLNSRQLAAPSPRQDVGDRLPLENFWELAAQQPIEDACDDLASGSDHALTSPDRMGDVHRVDPEFKVPGGHKLPELHGRVI